MYQKNAGIDFNDPEIDLYGADAAEWLKRWDDGRTVWSIEMGGLGPGYEQAIQITCAEILRIMLQKKYDATQWEDREHWKADREDIEKIIRGNKTIDRLGLSGAQWGAALSLASSIYLRGPIAIMNDTAVKDRRIQVNRSFPSV